MSTDGTCNGFAQSFYLFVLFRGYFPPGTRHGEDAVDTFGAEDVTTGSHNGHCGDVETDGAFGPVARGFLDDL